MDLFDLIDGFFKGVVYFVYNAVDTAWQLIRAPWAAPARLVGRHLHARQRQMGPPTFLFVTYLCAYLLSPLKALRSADLEAIAAGIAASRSAIDLDTLWPGVAAAFISTIVVDAPLRLFLRMRHAGERRRSDWVLGASEYAASLPVLWLAMLIILFLIATLLWPGFEPPLAMILVPAAAITLFGFAVVTAALARGPGEASGFRSADQFLGCVAGAAWLIGAPIIVGMYILQMASTADGYRMPSLYRPAGSRIEVLELRCALAEAPFADLLIESRKREPLLLYPQDLEIRDGADVYGATAAAEPTILEEGKPEHVRLALARSAKLPAAGPRCTLHNRSPRYRLEARLNGAPSG